MPLTDLSQAELEDYRTSARPPDGLDEFWAGTLEATRAAATPTVVRPVDTGLTLVDTWDVTFSGFAGDPIRAWLHRPAGRPGPIPAVVRFQGYGGGRGLPHSVGLWPLAGYACLEVDTRGQGGGYRAGDTADPHGSGPSHPGFLTRDVLDPAAYFYRRVYADAARAVDVVRELPDIDPERVAVSGGSQGGGLAIAAAALHPDVAAVLSDVPFLADFRRAAEVALGAPYTELAKYLAVHPDHAERVFATLDHFDVAVLGARASAPALFSVALMDETCPPSTVYAAYHAYGGPKELCVYPFNDHEGGHAFHEVEQLAFLRHTFAAVG